VHAEDYCSFVVDNVVNQVFSNRLADVSDAARRYVCEIELVASPSTSPSRAPTASVTPSVSPSFGSTLTRSPSITPSPSPSSLCQPGWSYYADDGSEGCGSCLLLSVGAFVNREYARLSCPVGSHLVTMRSSNPMSLTGLARFVYASMTTVRVWAGCSQSLTADYINVGWAWLDGTPASNLNCGTPGAVGCGVWTRAIATDFAAPRFVCTEADKLC
jgi:hypothetical protein